MTPIVHILVAPNGWYRYWPDFTPALIASIDGDVALEDIKALLAVSPSLREPAPDGDEFNTAKVIICHECEGSGEMEEDESSTELDEEGRPYQSWSKQVHPCPACGGDGQIGVSWGMIPAAKLFPKARAYKE